MRVRVRVAFGRRHVGEELEPALLHAARREDFVGEIAELVGAPAHDDRFEAKVVAQVNVHRRTNVLAERMLQIGEALRELADVMIIDDRERSDRPCA